MYQKKKKNSMRFMLDFDCIAPRTHLKCFNLLSANQHFQILIVESNYEGLVANSKFAYL